MKPKLDADQQKAVEHFEGPALVVAGPGSGKTTVIKERILHLIREHNVDPEQILALAFNRKASQEMEQRLSPKLKDVKLYQGKPEIRTLHAFGLRIIKRNYRRLNLVLGKPNYLKNEPNVWKSFELERTIKEEVAQLKREKSDAPIYIYIYKIGSKVTDKYYIGQTTDWKRRKQEHFADSSNSDLRQAILAEGREPFTFKVIDKVEGRFADSREAKWIEHYKNRAVFNPEFESEEFEKGTVNTPVTIYKIESKGTGRCYIGSTTDPIWNEENFMLLPNDTLHKVIKNDALHKAIKDEGLQQFTFEVIHENVPAAEARHHVEQEIEIHKNRAVFNQNNPLSQRYSDRLLIELFCQHFNVSYEELLKRPIDVKNLDGKIKDFEKIASEIEKEKREVVTGLFIPSSITNFIVRAFAEKYEKKKEKANAVDFQDMLIYSAHLLETCPDLFRRYNEKYDYVLVDEFQDISPADFRLIKLLPENLFAVGDDDQAIYGFRGGNSQIMQKDFGNRENVTKYEITRNYRSTSTIVRHAKTLIEHNPDRIPKNLRAENLSRPPIKVLETTAETVENVLLREVAEPVCQAQFIDNRIPPMSEDTLLKVPIETQKIGIPLRYRSEVEVIRKMLLARGFKEVKGDARRKEGDPFKVIGRGQKEIIEGGTIHSVKGKEYDKVILIHNTLGEDFPFHDSDNIVEERRVFYVAITRAKQEILILGGDCQFVAEAGLSALTSKRKKQLERVSRALESAIVKRIDIAKKQLEEVSEAVLAALKSEFKKQVHIASEAARKQYKPELNRLLRAATEAENAAQQAEKQLQTGLPKDLKVENEAILKELIPTLDSFESVVESANQNVETANVPDDFAAFTESVRHAQTQLLDLLKHHELKPIETSLGEIFNPAYHEEISAAIYSDEVPPNRVAREKQRGYLLQDIVIRKAQVVVSKGQNIRTPERLNQIVETYLDRLIAFKYGPKYDLDKPTIRRKMTEYLAALDKKSLKKINAGTTIDAGQSSTEQPLGNYCVGQHTMHMCTDVVFRNFWKRMWAVVEQSRKMPEPQIKPSSVPAPSKIKRVQPSAGQTGPTARLESPKEVSDSSPQAFTDGEIVKGIVVEVSRDEVRIDIGFKSEGYIPAAEFDTGQDGAPSVQIGDEIDVYIVRREDAEGQIVLSKKIADQTLVWDEIATAYENASPVKGRITERIKGGLRVSVGSLRGFLPASQVELRPIQHLEQYVGKTFDMKVISLSERRHNVVFSRRAWLEERRTQLLNTLEVGQCITGTVKNITTFGAFFDLGGVDGLLHKSEMAWKHIHHPSEIVSVGEEVEVKVIEFDRENEKISLSLKHKTNDPWEDVEEKYPVDSTVQGTVINIVHYGAFLELEEGIEGLIHVSEMSWTQRDVEPSHIVNKGDKVEAMVVKISKDARRISLSIKQCQQNPFEVAVAEPSADAPATVAEIESNNPSELTEPTIAKPIEETEEATSPTEDPPLMPEAEKDCLDDATNSITPEPLQEVDDTPSPMLQNADEILKTHIQELKPEPPETEIVSEPLEAVNNNTQLTSQEYEDILSKHIGEPKASSEPTQLLTDETSHDMESEKGASVDQTDARYLDSLEGTDDSLLQIEGKDLSEDKAQDVKKGFGYYLRQFGRFVRRKLK